MTAFTPPTTLRYRSLFTPNSHSHSNSTDSTCSPSHTPPAVARRPRPALHTTTTPTAIFIWSSDPDDDVEHDHFHQRHQQRPHQQHAEDLDHDHDHDFDVDGDSLNRSQSSPSRHSQSSSSSSSNNNNNNSDSSHSWEVSMNFHSQHHHNVNPNQQQHDDAEDHASSDDVDEHHDQDDDTYWSAWWRGDHQVHSHVYDDVLLNSSASVGPASPSYFFANPYADVYAVIRSLTHGPDDDLDRLTHGTAPPVTYVFRRIIHDMLGTLPADAFDIVSTCDRDAMTRLVASALRTGYATRNAETRLSLNESVRAADADGGVGASCGDADVDLSDVWGVVVLKRPSAHHDEQDHAQTQDPPLDEEVCVRDYILRLQRENARLRHDLTDSTTTKTSARRTTTPSSFTQSQTSSSSSSLPQPPQTPFNIGDRLIRFLQALSPQEITALHEDMGPHARFTCKACVNKIVGDLHGNDVQTTYTIRRDYVGRVLLWCLHVGYKTRDIEQRLEMKRLFDDTPQHVK